MVGLGSIGQRHVRNLKTVLGSDVEIMAWRTRKVNYILGDSLTVQSQGDLEREYSISTLDTLEEGLAQNPEAVFITNPTSLHMPVALLSAEAGCNIFIEKPLSHDLDDVNRLEDLVSRKGLVALVGYQMRFHPCFLLLKDLLDQEAVGTVLAVRLEVGEYLPDWHTYEDYRQMYAARSDLGGGVILTQIHELDLVYWLFGLPSCLFALGGHWSNLEMDVEDTSSILMECPYQGRPLPVHVQQDYLQKPASRTCEIVGDMGKISVDLPSLVVKVVSTKHGRPIVHRFDGFQRNQMFIDELNHFLACLAGKSEPAVSVHDGLQSLRMAMAARESIKRGEAVKL